MTDSQYTSIIWLTQGKYAIVDNEYYEFLNQWKWHVTANGYAARKEYPNRNTIRMHRMVNNTPIFLETDHINNHKLDNRKINLRSATKAENNINRPAHNQSTSKYKGVYWYKERGKWKAQICVNKKNRSLGYFECEREAALAYNKAAKLAHGSRARLNVI